MSNPMDVREALEKYMQSLRAQTAAYCLILYGRVSDEQARDLQQFLDQRHPAKKVRTESQEL